VLWRKKLIPITICLFWLIMMGLLWDRANDQKRGSTPNQPTVLSDVPTENWMGIYTGDPDKGGTRIGFIHNRTQPVTVNDEKGVEYYVTMNFATSVLDIPSEMTMKGKSTILQNSGLQKFSFKVGSDDRHVMEAIGETHDSIMKIDIKTAGETFPLEVPVENGLLLSGGMGTTQLNLPSLELGESITIPAFDPFTFSYSQTATIECVGEEMFSFGDRTIPAKILTTTVGGIPTNVWVSYDEEILKIETPFGFWVQKITQEQALQALDKTGKTDMLDSVAIRPTGLEPFRGAEAMTIRISGLNPEVSLPETTLQKQIEPRVYQIRQAKLTDEAEDALSEAELESYLKSDPFVQSSNPLIKAFATTIIQDKKDPWEQAELMRNWVYENIQKTIVLAFPSALDVLETLEGDCNEHTVLYAALARSQGIPTQIAIGIVWSDDLKGFYYHAWPEVFVDKWVPLEPTLGQDIADATHIKFLSGSIDQWPRLAAYIGQIQIEVLDIQ
jgi:hypothetical protein